MSNNTNKCFLCKKSCKSSETVSQLKWNGLKAKTEKWSELDKFGDVYETTAWTDDPKNYLMHNSCYISISSDRVLAKASNRRKHAQQLHNETSDALSSSSMPSTDVSREEESKLPTKRLRSSYQGLLHDKLKCVWCMVYAERRHKTPTKKRRSFI